MQETSSRIGEAFVGRIWLVLFVGLLLVGALFTLAQLWIFWPTALEDVAAPDGAQDAAVAAGGLPARKEVSYLGLARFELSTEVLFFLVVALSGALGGLIHTVRSLSTYVGVRRLRWSWVPYYLLLPLVGALGGTLFYVVLRAGLFSPSTEVQQASPFGFAAVAALVGLFSEQAMNKLRDLAAQIFTSAQPLADHYVDKEAEGRGAAGTQDGTAEEQPGRA
ncbi:MAG TPA: hypothetical protein VN213_06710 [Solirubrobacteraceae bacterium]|nr:hypothetical protein [Solirubrobacteraceae bacterium]